MLHGLQRGLALMQRPSPVAWLPVGYLPKHEVEHLAGRRLRGTADTGHGLASSGRVEAVQEGADLRAAQGRQRVALDLSDPLP